MSKLLILQPGARRATAYFVTLSVARRKYLARLSYLAMLIVLLDCPLMVTTTGTFVPVRAPAGTVTLI
jgi:hypothetical protein